MKRGLLLLTTAALALFLTGCGGSVLSKGDQAGASAQTEPPLKLETLSVEFSKEGLGAQDLLAAVRELQSPLQQALNAHGVAVERIQITVGSSPAATVQALEDGGIDLAFLPTQALAEDETSAQTLLVASPACPDLGDDPKDWNQAPEPVQMVPGCRALLCAAFTDYGKNLAGRSTLSWEELSRASWGVLGADSLTGRRAADLYLADHYDGNTLSDLPTVREYSDFGELLLGAANGEIDLLVIDAAARSDWASAWTLSPQETDDHGREGLGQPAPIWQALPVLALTERFYDRAAAVCPQREALADLRFASALAAAAADLTQDPALGPLASKVLGENAYTPASAEALNGLRRLLTLE